MNIPEDLKYTEDHEWVKIDYGKAVIGITDYAQKEMGDIVYVDFSEIGASVKSKDSFGVVESLKTVSDLYAPVTGEIFETNQALEETPELVNFSPYDKGWMVLIKMDDPSELDKLMSASEYEEYVKGLE